MPKRKEDVPDPKERQEIRETERRINEMNRDVPKDAPDLDKWGKGGKK